jgi:hypothetical protein
MLQISKLVWGDFQWQLSCLSGVSRASNRPGMGRIVAKQRDIFKKILQYWIARLGGAEAACWTRHQALVDSTRNMRIGTGRGT